MEIHRLDYPWEARCVCSHTHPFFALLMTINYSDIEEHDRLAEAEKAEKQK